MRIHRLVPLVALALAACNGDAPQAWQQKDGTPASATDISSCRQEANRQAGIAYPDRPANEAIGTPRSSNERNFAASIAYFDQCMTRSGYVRAAPKT